MRTSPGPRPRRPPGPRPPDPVLLTVFSLSARLSPFRGESFSCSGSASGASGRRGESMVRAAGGGRRRTGEAARGLGALPPARQALKPRGRPPPLGSTASHWMCGN